MLQNLSARVAVKPHPKYAEIKNAIQKLDQSGRPFSGVCYRCTEPKFADHIVSGEGSLLHGARWTPKGSFPTVYLCNTAEAALQEYLARGRRMRITDYRSLPMLMAGVKVKVGNLLDTTEPGVAAVLASFLNAEKVHWRMVQDRREGASQAIGRAIHEVCFSGLIALSQALPGGKNIILFPLKLGPSERLSAPA